MNKSDGHFISISAGTIFKAIVMLLLFYVAFLLKSLILSILTAVVIASAIEPITRWFRKYKIPRVVAVITIYLTTFVFVVGIFYIFAPLLVGDIVEIAVTIPQRLGELDKLNPFQVIGVTEQLNFNVANFTDEIRSLISILPKGFTETASFFFGGFFSFVLITVISFYLAVEEKGVENFLRIVAPSKQEAYILDLWKRSQRKIGLWMQGQLLLGLIIGVLVYLGLTILQIKYALVLAILAAMFELIPLFGPLLAAVPAILLGFTQGPSVGLMVVGLYVIIQQFENHLIYPLVVKKIVGVPPIVVIVAIIAGGVLAGFLGILISVPLAAVLMELANDIEKKKRTEGVEGSK